MESIVAELMNAIASLLAGLGIAWFAVLALGAIIIWKMAK